MATCIHCGEWFEGGGSSDQPVCLTCQGSFAFPPSKPTSAPKRASSVDPKFDPYHTWLGIPPAKQPANHYQLLGLTRLEPNPDVIATAADRQTTHLRSFLSSPQVCDAERLLAEVEAARVCLLNEHTKAAYDQAIQGSTFSPSETQPVASRSVPVLTPAPQTSVSPPQPVSQASREPIDRASTSSPSRPKQIRQRRAKPPRSPVVQIVQIVVGGIAGCAIGYYLGFVLLPSIRARRAESKAPPKRELVIRQSPTISSDRSLVKRRATAAKSKPDPTTKRNRQSPPVSSSTPTPSKSNPATNAAATITGSATAQPTRSTSGTAATAARQQSTSVQAPPAIRTSTAESGSRQLRDLVSPSKTAVPAASLPLVAPLPKRTTSLAQELFLIPATFTIESPRLLTDAASLQEGENLYLDETKDAGVRSWIVRAAIPDTIGDDSLRDVVGDDSLREIGEFSESDGKFSFRWFSRATAEDEALLMNSMLKLSNAEQQQPIALRDATKVTPLQFDMDQRRETHAFGVGAVPRDDCLTLELGDLSVFPSRARYQDNVQELAIGRSTAIVFDDVPGAELEVRFQRGSTTGLTIAASPRFRENSASVLAMTKSQLETTLRSIEKTIARAQADIRNGNAALSRLRGQSTSRLSGAEAAGLAGLINKTQSRVNSDERKVVQLKAKLANGPRIRGLLDALHHRPTLAFRIIANAGGDAQITLVDGGLQP